MALNLNPTQWDAWEAALSHRARLIWGPPGTGKSRTVRTLIVGAVLEAHLAGRPLRVLLSAFTYNAIDNVLIDVANDLDRLIPGVCSTYRVRSQYQATPDPANLGAAIDIEVNRQAPQPPLRDMKTDLDDGTELMVIGAPTEQVYNLFPFQRLSDGTEDITMQQWFDVIVIDEASQMDVAHMILPLCGLADGGSVILAGDPLQLPPIQPAEAPTGLEHLVGSSYGFFQRIHQVPESPLGINYRSNETLVGFARLSGYQSTLQSFSPDLGIDLLNPLPSTQPADWPARIAWSPEWCARSSTPINRRSPSSMTTGGAVSATSSKPRPWPPCCSC